MVRPAPPSGRCDRFSATGAAAPHLACAGRRRTLGSKGRVRFERWTPLVGPGATGDHVGCFPSEVPMPVPRLARPHTTGSTCGTSLFLAGLAALLVAACSDSGSGPANTAP